MSNKFLLYTLPVFVIIMYGFNSVPAVQIGFTYLTILFYGILDIEDSTVEVPPLVNKTRTKIRQIISIINAFWEQQNWGKSKALRTRKKSRSPLPYRNFPED